MRYLSTLTTLDLYNKSLLSLPTSFGNLTQLTHLDLSHNKLTTLPSSFGNLTALQYLDISENPSLAQSPQSLEAFAKLVNNPSFVGIF